ncbi:MAG: glutamine synthetase family protein [Pseudomonadota bacterium]|nr:glutamine synthetase family protein [Pseudomonadota bacterium]
MQLTRQFLNAYPDITMVEALITDCNGIARGKWLPVQKLDTIEEQGLKLPKSALGLDVWGRDIPALAHANGDIDGYCHLVEGSLRPLLTERGVDQAQVLLSMFDKDGSPYMGDPRQVLQALVTRFTEKELKPCMAVELEFSLLPKPETSETIGTALRDQNAVGGNLYALSELDYHGPLLEALRQAFDTQDLPYEGIIKESAPSQFEINVAHSDDVMLLADQVIRMQRTIRAVSARHGFVASFMPKPIDNEAGNGLHVHCSLLDENGTNVFDDGGEEGSDLLRYAVAGCLELLPASMLLFAPSFNAYRRFQPGNHAPTESAWGYDNRTTAIRIPESPSAARRIEHRVAGADANPSLVLAAVLAGIWHGIENMLSPPDPVEGSAWDQEIDAPALPTTMDEAISVFDKSDVLSSYLTGEFKTLFLATKVQEWNEFAKRVTEFELETYLRM